MFIISHFTVSAGENMVKIGVVGTGFVGLTHAAVTSRFHTVVGYDINEERIADFSSGSKERIERHVNERGLAELVNNQIAKDHQLTFTIAVTDVVNCEAFFMCLPTPYKQNGETNLEFLIEAAEKISDELLKRDNDDFVLFINKSTVPIGTAEMLSNFLKKKGLTNFDVASNPEFLPEGEAVKYSIHPEKVVVGARKQESIDLLRRIYFNANDNPNTRYIECENPETAEAIKYGSNIQLYSQIVAWQAISGRVCEAYPEVNFEVMRKGILADSRVAKWGSYVSAGAGGSCFKKDSLSLARQLNKRDVNSRFIELIDEINEQQKGYLIPRAENEAGYSFNTKRVSILGAAFKQGTNDIRESNVLVMIPMLIRRGVDQIKVYDPHALDEARKYFDPEENKHYKCITYHAKLVDALEGSDAVIIATDIQDFRALPDILEKLENAPSFILDGRRMVPRQEVPRLVDKGISYLPVAGTYVKGK